MYINKISFSLLIAVILLGKVLAQNPVIYPAGGQSTEQQEKDKFECVSWAKQNTGYDPMQTSAPPPPQSQPKRGGVARGAAGGAIVGGIIDGSDGAKKGAGIGAIGGGVRQGAQNQKQQAQQQQQQQQEQNNQAAKQSEYNRAYSACLEGRGYTVK